MTKEGCGSAIRLFLAVALLGFTLHAQPSVVRFYVPDSHPTVGRPVAPPFSGSDEIRYLMIIARDRLPRNGGALQALSFLPVESGEIVADDFSIVVGEAPAANPEREFGRNLSNFVEVYRQNRLRLTGISPGKPVTFQFFVPYNYVGGTHLAVQIRFRGLTQGVRFLAASSRVRAVYAAGKGAYGAQNANAALEGLKTALDFLASQPSITSYGSAAPGTSLGLTFNASSNIGDAYLAGCAFTTFPGIDIGEYTIPLNPDGLFFAVWRMPGVFQGFEGRIGAFGVETGAVAIPQDTSLIGVSFAIAFVTMGGGGGLSNVSMEHWVTIGAGG